MQYLISKEKPLWVLHVQHKFSDDFFVGATILNINERPLTPKVNFGAEANR